MEKQRDVVADEPTRSRQELVEAYASYIKCLTQTPLLDVVEIVSFKLPWRNEIERGIMESIEPAEIAAEIVAREANEAAQSTTCIPPTHEELATFSAETLALTQKYLEASGVAEFAELATKLRLPDIAGASRTLAHPYVALQTRPRSCTRPPSVRIRRRRVRRGSRRARSPGRSADDDPEPPLAPLSASDRRALKALVDSARRLAIERVADWRLCSRCQREQEPEEFSLGATYCRSCERERLVAYRQSRSAVAA